MIQVPIRDNKLNIKFLVIPLEKNVTPSNIKIIVREICKHRFKEYHESIQFVPDVQLNTEVEVNSFGRWLFGVPGYKGHWISRSHLNDTNTIEIFLPDHEHAIDLIKKALEQMKNDKLILFKEIKD